MQGVTKKGDFSENFVSFNDYFNNLGDSSKRCLEIFLSTIVQDLTLLFYSPQIEEEN